MDAVLDKLMTGKLGMPNRRIELVELIARIIDTHGISQTHDLTGFPHMRTLGDIATRELLSIGRKYGNPSYFATHQVTIVFHFAHLIVAAMSKQGTSISEYH